MLSTIQHSTYKGSITLHKVKHSYEAGQISVINGWMYAQVENTAFYLDREMLREKGCLHALYVVKMAEAGKVAEAAPQDKYGCGNMAWAPWRSAMAWAPQLSKLHGFRQCDVIGISTLTDAWDTDGVVPFDYLSMKYEMTPIEVLPIETCAEGEDRTRQGCYADLTYGE
ncbi:hypothetical protein NDU88_002451 [Pleurodeles waltl]|uniref:Uncharacterized protein n=1 Tax=Pleurodeles waltl TaxID=8319 RepID=A0AAV7UAV6_PLEWA|nr:hypothetical protein NDU88_002451 [Pleurodeles waltl]